jgi:hypothetical protein
VPGNSHGPLVPPPFQRRTETTLLFRLPAARTGIEGRNINVERDILGPIQIHCRERFLQTCERELHRMVGIGPAAQYDAATHNLNLEQTDQTACPFGDSPSENSFEIHRGVSITRGNGGNG